MSEQSSENTVQDRAIKICFISAMSLIDRRSGSATTMRNALECLSRRGFDCSAITASLFDVGGNDFSFSEASGRTFDFDAHVGKAINFEENGIDQTIYVTNSPNGQKLTVDEIKEFYRLANHRLSEIKPDIVLTYGSSSVAQALHQSAQRVGAYVVFYLPNPSYDDRSVFDHCDKVICPSEYIADYYRRHLGIDAEAVRCIQLFDRFVEPEDRRVFRQREGRATGFVTMTNPNPVKGGTLFYRLLELAARERPDITFLALESRASLAQWKNAGCDFSKFHNLWWLRSQREMSRVYGRTSVLIFPAFWNETSARTIAEAQLSGIPVIASDRGGNREQLNGAGQLLDVPDRCTKDYIEIPSTAEVRPWLDALCALLDDDRKYQAAAEAAIAAAEPFERSKREHELVRFFENLVEGR